MKKLLALVLALVMTLGLATVGTNAAFTDQTKVDESEYSEAITVLNGMGVFKGDENGNFNPKDLIDRASTAAMIYRLYTGDTGTSKVGIYANDKFSDVSSSKWYAGYIGYCENAEFIYGAGDGKFYPDANVTGYQALAMVLRAMGRNQQNDFTGDDWELTTARFASDLGLVKNVSAEVLKQPASRELVAEILWEAAQKPTYTYTPAAGYEIYNNILTHTADTLNPSLGVKNFSLYGPTEGADSWGRPTKDWGTKSDTDAYASIAYKATKTYYDAVTECDLAEAVGQGNSTVAYTTYVNAQNSVTYSVRPLATTTKIGAPGRVTEVYYNYNAAGDDRIVMVDTFLARVATVTNATFDANGHLRTPSVLGLQVYLTDTANTATGAGAVNYRMTNGKTNYDYAVGDYLLINAKTTDAAVQVAPWIAGAQVNNLAGSANVLVSATDSYGNANVLSSPAKIVGKPTELTGAQTKIHFKDGLHTVNGTDYNDAIELHLDQAKNEISNHTWLFDTKADGSQWLIGIIDIATQYNYGAIKNLWWAGNTTTGGGAAMATLVYMDGTEETVTLGEVRINTGAQGAAVTDDYAIPTYSTATGLDMTVTAGTATAPGVFYVTPYTATNAAAAGNTAEGIIGGHMFRFSKLANGAVFAEEVTKELQNNLVVTKNYSPVTGTKWVLGDADIVYTNANTVYLIREVNAVTNAVTYKSVTGFANVDSYTGDANAKFDYVDLNADGFVDYAYIIGTPTAAVTSNLFYLTTTGLDYTRNTNGAILDYILTGYVDGVLSSIKVANAGANYSNIVAPIIDAGANKMWVVRQTNGYTDLIQDADGDINTTGVKYATSTSFALSNMNPANVAYTNSRIIALTGGATDVTNGDVYVGSNGQRYNITGVTPLVGAWAADMSNFDVVLVYKTIGTLNVVEQAYVYDKTANANAFTASITATVNGVADASTTMNVTVGDTIALTAVATPAAAPARPLGLLTYKWFKDGVEITSVNASTIGASGYTTATLTITAKAAAASDGAYTVEITNYDNGATGTQVSKATSTARTIAATAAAATVEWVVTDKEHNFLNPKYISSTGATIAPSALTDADIIALLVKGGATASSIKRDVTAGTWTWTWTANGASATAFIADSSDGDYSNAAQIGKLFINSEQVGWFDSTKVYKMDATTNVNLSDLDARLDDSNLTGRGTGFVLSYNDGAAKSVYNAYADVQPYTLESNHYYTATIDPNYVTVGNFTAADITVVESSSANGTQFVAGYSATGLKTTTETPTRVMKANNTLTVTFTGGNNITALTADKTLTTTGLAASSEIGYDSPHQAAVDTANSSTSKVVLKNGATTAQLDGLVITITIPVADANVSATAIANS